MKKLIQITLALTLTSFAAGCHDASKDVEKYADKMCACSDATCANKVMDDFAKWAHDNKDSRGDEDKAKTAAERFFKCSLEKGVSADKIQAIVTDLQ